MKMNNRNSFLQYDEVQREGSSGQPKYLLRYLRYWKWFLLSIVICLGLGLLYLRNAAPVYEVKAKILLENTTDNVGSTLPDFGLFNIKSNADNELEVLNTSYLMELAVRKLGIYAQYVEIGEYTNRKIYGSECPISVRLPEAALDTLRGKLNFEVLVRPDSTYLFSGDYKNSAFKIRATEKDSQLVLPFGTVYFATKPGMPLKAMRIGVSLESPSRIGDRYLSSMSISLASQTTTAVNLSLRTSDIREGTDFINALLEIYKEEDVKDQAMMANNTSAYLDNLLESLGNELSIIEKQVESFKQREGITNVSSEAQLFLQRTGQYEQRRLEVGTQLGIIRDLENYINKKENRNQLLPSGIGIQSASLNSLISEYNNLLLERKRLSRTATENNQVMIDLTDRIEALYGTVQSTISSEKRNLMISQQDLIQKDKENAQRIKSIPRQERQISDLSRQQDIKSQLYLFLLQKRDESYLNMAAVAPKFKIIGYPRSNGFPVDPKRNVILFLSLIFGIILPFTGISIRNLIHYTVESKDELKEISSIPILGEIPKSKQSGRVLIYENSSSGFTEMFRLLRTNLLFVLDDPSKKVINIVSSINGEGKTFISINLATSLALIDRKVLMICLDIRKPKMDEYLGIDNDSGITQYLSGQLDRQKLVRPSGAHPNLWVITAGPVSPNPNELLSKPAMDDLILQFRNQFDYIVIDTPPVGAVSDCLLLNRFADINLYIVRADYTPKKAVIAANEINDLQKLHNMYFVLNAADLRKSSTYSYGYRRKYGNGYGYYYQDNKQKRGRK